MSCRNGRVTCYVTVAMMGGTVPKIVNILRHSGGSDRL